MENSNPPSTKRKQQQEDNRQRKKAERENKQLDAALLKIEQSMEKEQAAWEAAVIHAERQLIRQQEGEQARFDASILRLERQEMKLEAAQRREQAQFDAAILRLERQEMQLEAAQRREQAQFDAAILRLERQEMQLEAAQRREQAQFDAAILHLERQEAQLEASLDRAIRQEERLMAAEQRQRERNARLERLMARLNPARQCNLDSITLFNDIHSYYNVGSCNFCCSHCGALGFDSENRGTSSQRHYGILCCNQGKIMLDDLPDLPPTLENLFTSEDTLAQYFRKNIRRFNAGMSLCSFQATDKTVTTGEPGAFKVVGQTYRRMGSTTAGEDSDAKCLQIYFLDPGYQATLRAQRYIAEHDTEDQRDVQLFSLLHTALTQEADNSYIRSFLTIVEWIRHSDHNPDEVQLELHETERPSGGQHRGRFHLPTAPE
eukprot:scaffold76058_cov23-Cyclotella_meneghiniana.AAC.1